MPPPTSLPGTELNRLAAIAKVAVRNGLAHYAAKLGFSGAGADAPREGLPAADARRLREALESLGPTFVKFGQMLSTRRDLFPDELIAELSRLHATVGEFPAELARKTVEEDLGMPLEELFSSFEDKPVAAGSMAQVHRAALADGTPVAVKIQRPGIAEMVESDIAILGRIAQLLDAAFPSMRAFNLRDLVEDFGGTLRQELDFMREAENTERFAAANLKEPGVFVPRVFRALTTRRVLTMEYSAGYRLDSSEARQLGPGPVAQLLMRLFLTQVFEHGIFHADPHPGNVWLLPDGRLCFQDFGALGELSPPLQENLRQVFLAVIARDPSWLASAYLGLGGSAAELDRHAFVSDLSAALERFHNRSGTGPRSIGAMLHEFVRVGRNHQIRLPRSTTMMLKAFAELESLLHGVDPDFSTLEAFRRYSPRLIRRALRPRLGNAGLAQAYRSVVAGRETAAGLPVAVRRLFGRLDRGEPLFDIRHQSSRSIERHLLHASNRLAFSLIIASIVIGSSLLLAARSGPEWDYLALVGSAGFAIAGALGITWAIVALRSGKL